VLYTLRKLRFTLGRTLVGVLLLAWLGAALQPCVMAGSPVTHHMSSQAMGDHDCCPPAPGKQLPAPDCSAQSCAMQSIDQQQTDLLLLTRLGVLFGFALLLALAWPRLAPLARTFSLPRVPPPHPHPTLAFCTLLI
jgi:hypothetical protein